ncbi:hypothetical protein BaRGS_00016950, partial [Batillaria attramentaria]
TAVSTNEQSTTSARSASAEETSTVQKFTQEDVEMRTLTYPEDDDAISTQVFDVTSLATGAGVSFVLVTSAVAIWVCRRRFGLADADSYRETQLHKNTGTGSTWNFRQSHVKNAKTAFYSAKVAAATTCRELFRLTGNLMGKCTQTPLPSIHPPHQLAQIFSDFFCEKISSLRIALDSQMSSSVQPAFQDRMFSGTPLTCFDVVSQEAVRKIALS